MNEKDITNIAFNFAPINGNIEEQNVNYNIPENKSDAGAQQENGEPKTDRLSQRELVILMSELLGVSSLQKEYLPGGQDALAYIVSLMSGDSQNSIRQKIRELAEEQQKGKFVLKTVKGAEKVADLIKKFNSQIASNIREHYDCDE